jgi:DNA gyrase inhibitor GyrI
MPDEAVIVVAIIFGGAFAVAIVAIVADTIRKTAQTRAREESRREIAAYVSEGTISPEDAVRLMEASGGPWKDVRDLIKGRR